MKIEGLTGQIENYENLSAEEKLAALMQLELEDTEALKQDNLKLKNANNKISSEVAEYKRQLKEKMSEDERKEAEAKEKQEAMETELNTLRKEKALGEYKAQYIALGYSEEDATLTAKALYEGDTKKVVELQKKFLENKKSEWEKESLNHQPDLSKGGNGEPLTVEKIMAIKDPTERQKAIADNITLFE